MLKKQLSRKYWKLLFILNLTILSLIPTQATLSESASANAKNQSNLRQATQKFNSKQIKQQLNIKQLNIKQLLKKSKPRKVEPSKKTFPQRLRLDAPKRKSPNTTPVRPVRTVRPARKFIYFRQPQRQGTPRGTRPAGKRGCTIASQIPFSAIVPVTQGIENTELRWGITTKKHPTFWFYIPHQIKSVKNVKFSLRNRNNKTIYETPIKLTNAPGIISFSLPYDAPHLEINQWYQYYLFVDRSCNPNRRLQKDVAQGWVKREAINSQLQAQLDTAISNKQKAILYAQNGIWYETIDTLAMLSESEVRNNTWSYILEYAGLDGISRASIINCCSPYGDQK